MEPNTMSNPFDTDFLAACDAEFDAAPTKRSTGKFARRQFKCEACNGTGLWAHGKANRYGNEKCNTCHGHGYLVTDPRTRAKQRQRRRDNKQAALRAAVQGNIDTGLVDKLAPITDWNDFARSLMDQHIAGRAWSDKQVAAAERMVAKVEASRAAKAAAKEAAAVAVDLSAIEAMFATALASGYKKPAYRANDLRVKPGKAGALYVFDERQVELGMYGETPAYVGKIVDAKFYGTRKAADDTAAKLQAIAADPRGEAVRFGQRTGRCSCCGRELTKHTSIEAGIGPICAEKWGL